MDSFKKAVKRIAEKKWDYDFQEIIEGIKEDVKKNPLHKRIQEIRAGLIVKRKGTDSAYRQKFFWGLEAIVIFAGDLIIFAGLVIYYLLDGLFRLVFLLCRIKIEQPCKDMLDTSGVFKWYCLIGLGIIYGLLYVSQKACFDVWGQP